MAKSRQTTEEDKQILRSYKEMMDRKGIKNASKQYIADMFKLTDKI